ncbi:MAG: allophanate hydrolase subunit 1 [Marinosulfonomonas sp.]|nr:allophanate hydrolase subunit 1 [Marinosulfonomonas sp.]
MNAETSKSDPGREFPRLTNIGLSGILVTFSDELSEPANRAALAFRARLGTESWDGVEETTTSLTSVYIRFDPSHLSHEAIRKSLIALIESEDWFASSLPRKRRLWHIPTVYGGSFGPQLPDAAALAQMSASEAISQISSQRLRVLTIGFAPGQPYLGTLPEAWDIPRQSGLSAQIPACALAVAIRQLVLFTAQTPTGWRHIAQTGFQGFRPETETPFALRPGDEVMFPQVNEEAFANILAGDRSDNGGAVWEYIK